jgi:hypothetical protein
MWKEAVRDSFKELLHKLPKGTEKNKETSILGQRWPGRDLNPGSPE